VKEREPGTDTWQLVPSVKDSHAPKVPFQKPTQAQEERAAVGEGGRWGNRSTRS